MPAEHGRAALAGPGATVADLGEHGVIAAFRARVPPAPGWLPVGIGDDAAVLEPARGDLEVLTADSLVEGVHFDRRFSSPFDVGWKALAVNVSDVAAMGAAPRAALLSLALPAALPVADLEALADGFMALAARTRVVLAGGNVTRSPGPLVVDVTVTGSARRRAILRRSGARPGDAIYVTGAVGAGVAGLEYLRAREAEGQDLNGADLEECAERYRRPDPRLRVGMLLGRARAASACMDLSDGLADAVTQVAAASGVGARIDAAAVPVAAGAARWFAARGQDATTAAVAGGDDYELLFTVPRKARGRLKLVLSQARGVPLTRIGEITAERDIVLVRNGAPQALPPGFVHF